MIVINRSGSQMSEVADCDIDRYRTLFGNWLRNHGILHEVGDTRRHPGNFFFLTSNEGMDIRQIEAAAGYLEGPHAPETLQNLELEFSDRRVNGLFFHADKSSDAQVFDYADESGNPPFGFRSIRTAPRMHNAASFVREHAERGDTIEAFDVQYLVPTERWKAVMWASETPEPRDALPVVVTDGKWIVSGVPLMALLGAKLSIFPLGSAYFDEEVRSLSWRFDHWFQELVFQTCADNDVEVWTINPWPFGYRSSFTLRHDYDRAIPISHMKRLLQAYSDLGIKTSVGFLSRILPDIQIEMLFKNGHEVVVHSETDTLDGFIAEREKLEFITRSSVAGATFHGGVNATGVRGSKSIEWAEEAGLVYTETYLKTGLFHKAHYRRENEWLASDVISIPFHQSFDYWCSASGKDLPGLRAIVNDRLAAGIHVSLMNHPDINSALLLPFLKSLNLADAWCATHAEISTWAAGLSAVNVEYVNNRPSSLDGLKGLPHDIELTVRKGQSLETVRVTPSDDRVQLWGTGASRRTSKAGQNSIATGLFRRMSDWLRRN